MKSPVVFRLCGQNKNRMLMEAAVLSQKCVRWQDSFGGNVPTKYVRRTMRCPLSAFCSLGILLALGNGANDEPNILRAPPVHDVHCRRSSSSTSSVAESVSKRAKIVSALRAILDLANPLALCSHNKIGGSVCRVCHRWFFFSVALLGARRRAPRRGRAQADTE